MGQIIFQTFLGTLGTVGFSVLFNVPGRKMFASALGATISWTVYMAVFHAYGDKVISLFAATITASVLSEILARVLKAPVIILLVPMLIPLIPEAICITPPRIWCLEIKKNLRSASVWLCVRREQSPLALFS